MIVLQKKKRDVGIIVDIVEVEAEAEKVIEKIQKEIIKEEKNLNKKWLIQMQMKLLEFKKLCLKEKSNNKVNYIFNFKKKNVFLRIQKEMMQLF